MEPKRMSPDEAAVETIATEKALELLTGKRRTAAILLIAYVDTRDDGEIRVEVNARMHMDRGASVARTGEMCGKLLAIAGQLPRDYAKTIVNVLPEGMTTFLTGVGVGLALGTGCDSEVNEFNGDL